MKLVRCSPSSKDFIAYHSLVLLHINLVSQYDLHQNLATDETINAIQTHKREIIRISW